MVDVIIRVVIPEEVKFFVSEGEVDGFQYVFIAEEGTNRLLFDVNTTLCRVRFRNMPEPEPEPEPEPIPPMTYAPYHVLRELNVRSQPNTNLPVVEPISPLPVNTNLDLSTEIIDSAADLQRLGMDMTIPIQEGYKWRHIQTGNFVATLVNGNQMVAEGYHTAPTTSPNLSVVSEGGKLGVAIKGDSRPVEGFVNIRPIAFCGIPNRVQGTTEADIPRLLDRAQSLGVRLVRFYTACYDLTPAQCADRVKVVLDELQRRGMYGILVLNDSLGSGFHVKGDDAYRDFDMGHLTYDYYTEGAYRGAFQQHVNAILAKVGNHPAVGSFDIMNETGGYGRGTGVPIPTTDTSAIRAFGAFTLQLIRSKSQHWVNWGIINAAHVGCDTPSEAEAFYKGLGLNVLGVHLYDENGDDFWQQESRALSIDMPLAKKMGLPIWIDEIGVKFDGENRRSDYAAAIERYRSWSAGFGFWGFSPISNQMNLSDDKGVAVDFSDYNDLASLIGSYS